MTATPLRDASPAARLAAIASRHAGDTFSESQREQLDQRAAALVSSAGELANAAIIVANFTLTESAAATLSVFSSAVAAFTSEPLPQVREGDDEVEQPVVFKLIRVALDLGTDASVIGKDVDRVISLYRSAFFAAGAGRDLAMVEALPQSILEDVSCQGVVDCYNRLAYEHYFRVYRDHAVNDLPARKARPSRDKEMQVDDLGEVLACIALARAGVAEVLGAMFDLGKHGDLLSAGASAVADAGIIRATAVLERMVKMLPETPPANVFSFAETLEDFRHLAKPRAKPVPAAAEVESIW